MTKIAHYAKILGIFYVTQRVGLQFYDSFITEMLQQLFVEVKRVSKKNCKNLQRKEQVAGKSKKWQPFLWAFALIFLLSFVIFSIILLTMPANNKVVSGHRHDALPAELEPYVADVATSGDNLLLMTGYDEEVDSVSIDYLQVSDLEQFISKCKLPIVLLIREQGQRGKDIINPYIEDLAETWRKQLYVILVEPDQKSEFLSTLDFRYLPTCYLLLNKEVKKEINGYSQENLAAFSKAVADLLGSKSNENN